MGEECSEEELDYQDSMPVGGPSVITFQDPGKKPEVLASDRALRKAFMVRNYRQTSYPLDSITPRLSHRRFANFGKNLQIQQRKRNLVRMMTWTCVFTSPSLSLHMLEIF